RVSSQCSAMACRPQCGHRLHTRSVGAVSTTCAITICGIEHARRPDMRTATHAGFLFVFVLMTGCVIGSNNGPGTGSDGDGNSGSAGSCNECQEGATQCSLGRDLLQRRRRLHRLGYVSRLLGLRHMSGRGMRSEMQSYVARESDQLDAG